MVKEIAGADNLRTAINRAGREAAPFLFLINFEAEKGVVLPVSEIPRSGLACIIRGKRYGAASPPNTLTTTHLRIKPVPEAEYAAAFNKVTKAIRRGDSYLTNLTFRTPVGRDVDMVQVFENSEAPYRFLWPGRFVFFSPESFVRIENGKISSYPMKGTIDASHPDAGLRLLSDYKETCEHNTIVDLIRNDLSSVADNVKVERFRYIEKIRTHKGELLQSSSQITGQLPQGWQQRTGDIIFSLLPAGSISGAPKRKTVEIIKESETTPRGYYTGVMGVYDSGMLDSCVIIRYIERDADGEYHYRSGGGITSCSIMQNEYREMTDKIYVPII